MLEVKRRRDKRPRLNISSFLQINYQKMSFQTLRKAYRTEKLNLTLANKLRGKMKKPFITRENEHCP